MVKDRGGCSLRWMVFGASLRLVPALGVNWYSMKGSGHSDLSNTQ